MPNIWIYKYYTYTLHIIIPPHKEALPLMQRMTLRHKEISKARNNSTRPTCSMRQPERQTQTVVNTFKKTFNHPSLGIKKSVNFRLELLFMLIPGISPLFISTTNWNGEGLFKDASSASSVVKNIQSIVSTALYKFSNPWS